MYIYDFPVDLTNNQDIIRVGAFLSFVPRSRRQIMIDYDNYNGDIAFNKYGSVFLVERRTTGNNFNVYLMAESYYSAPNSRLFKMVHITGNEQCISMNLDQYYEISPEDQIAVSFICN